MNKKNLSVVMAGAMLATSVAPVLAATNTVKEYEVTEENRGLLIKELRNLLTSKTYANEDKNNGKDGNYAGKSVYEVSALNVVEKSETVANGKNYVTINSKLAEYGVNSKSFVATGGNNTSTINAELEKLYTFDTTDGNIVTVKFNTIGNSGNAVVTKIDKVKTFDGDSVTDLETFIKSATAGTELLVTNRGYVEKNGKYYAYALEDVAGTETELVYSSKTELEKEFNNWEKDPSKYPAVYKMEYTDGTLTVKTRAAASETENLTLTYKVGDKNVDFTKAVDQYGDLTNDLSKVVGFKVEVDTEGGVKAGSKIESENIAKITITDVNKKHEVALSSLYDGLFLTENGQDLVDTLKDTDNYSYTTSLDSSANGIYALNITITKDSSKEKTLVTVKSNNEDQLNLFAGWIKEDNKNKGTNVNIPVQVLAGDNRYETAVKVAKENASIKDVAENGNIVLVNGNSLVDGLAAAPLAASTWNQENGDKALSAPILLTESNSIPTATKEYMKELIAKQQVGKLDQVTIYLVGGTSVISKSVENELKEIGFRVVRAGGEDREATSLAVAELMAKDGKNVKDDEAFFVGANGEADAMSIAPVAAKSKTPIIVESVHGVTEDTVNYLKGYKNSTADAKDVTIIGGTSSVSEATEKTLKDEKITVDRIAGSNRQATNAKVISQYYNESTFNKVVVSKDGINNKSELIDALTATTLAVKHNSPIVLGTNKLSNDQINTLELKASSSGVYVYQVGYGVARDVVKTIAEKVGLAK